MNLTRWQPANTVWNQLQQLQQEMNQLFSRWGDDGGRGLGVPGGFPPLNVWEDGDQVYVEAELPGLNLKDLEILVTDGNQLVIKGEQGERAGERHLAPARTQLRQLYPQFDVALPCRCGQGGRPLRERGAAREDAQARIGPGPQNSHQVSRSASGLPMPSARPAFGILRDPYKREKET